MKNKTYDTLKFIAQIVLPAIATFYVTLANLWKFFPYPQEISGTIMAVDTLLGALLMISSANYIEKKEGNQK